MYNVILCPSIILILPMACINVTGSMMSRMICFTEPSDILRPVSRTVVVHNTFSVNIPSSSILFNVDLNENWEYSSLFSLQTNAALGLLDALYAFAADVKYMAFSPDGI